MKFKLTSLGKDRKEYELSITTHHGKAYLICNGNIVAEISASTMWGPLGEDDFENSPGVYIEFHPNIKSIDKHVADIYNDRKM